MLGVQTKLAVNLAGDPYEQEADRVAGDVMRTPDAASVPAPLRLQRREAHPGGPTIAPPSVDEVLRLPGQPLDIATRAFMESRFGHDFSRVRVHTDARAAASAQQVNALAYTVGRDVVFGAGQYQPSMPDGRRLIAHELAHIVQQTACGQSNPSRISRPDEASGMEAKAAGRVIASGGQSAPALRTPPPGMLARRDKPGSASPLAAIKDIRLSITTKPKTLRQPGSPGTVDVLIKPMLRARAEVTVARGPDAERLEFGFLQLGRPFEVHRATYLQDGAAPGTRRDLDYTATMKIRKRLPALDHADFWFSTPGSSRGGSSVRVDYSDLPTQFFQLGVQKNGASYRLSGISYQAFLFTAFSVKDSGGTLHHLKTFYWDIKYCERIPLGTDLSKPKTGPDVNVAPVRDCRSGSCDTNEPGFDKVNQKRSSDTYVAAVNEGKNDTHFEGPGNFDIGCS